MRLKITVIFFLLILCAICCAAGLFYPTAEITLRVTDTNGVPIQDADVSVVFAVPKGTGLGLGVNTTVVKGKTNKEGLFTASGTTTEGVTSSVIKEGYYRGGGGRVPFTEKSLGRLQPWNPTIEVVLKKKKNPTQMLAKNTSYIDVPVLDKPVGYDLEKGDWVTPYGQGNTVDFVFIFSTRVTSGKDWDCSLVLTFSNKLDGILEYYPNENDRSEYKWPYEAPETGYKQELKRNDLFTPDGHYQTDYDKEKGYIFRIRTQTNNLGEIVDARYGKIKGDIELSRSGKIRFTYYFNPTGSRCLEYDTENPMLKWSRHESEYKVVEP